MPRINLCNLCDLDTDVTAATLQEIVTCLHEYYFDLFEEFDPRHLNIIIGVKQITPTLYEMYIKDSYDNGRVNYPPINWQACNSAPVDQPES